MKTSASLFQDIAHASARQPASASSTSNRLPNRIRRVLRRLVRQAGDVTFKSVGGTITQTLYNGFQTGNRTRQAEAQVFAARETLRVAEQQVLLNAVTAYMNLLRDTAILDLQRSNVRVLEAQLRQTRDRFNVGEITRTDVAQASPASRLASRRCRTPRAISPRRARPIAR